MEAELPMTLSRAEELLHVLYNDRAQNISKEWQKRLIEALEYVVNTETKKDEQ